MNTVMNVITSRRSHRSYLPTPPTREQLETLMEAAVASPSAVNRQPWHFTVVQDQKIIDRVNECAVAEMLKMGEDQTNPKLKDPAFHIFFHAPAVIFIGGLKDNYWTHFDCGIACENIVLAAESLGLGTVILGMPRHGFFGPDGDELRSLVKFPPNYDFAIAIAVGTPDDTKPAHRVKPDKIDWID